VRRERSLALAPQVAADWAAGGVYFIKFAERGPLQKGAGNRCFAPARNLQRPEQRGATDYTHSTRKR
jgi:hypothetical protein